MSNRVLAMSKAYSVEAVQAVESFTIETPGGQETVQPGDWVVNREGVYYVYTDKKFQYDFEVVADLSKSFSINASDVEPTDEVVATPLRLVGVGDDGKDFEVTVDDRDTS